jgi:hypothetical protein
MRWTDLSPQTIAKIKAYHLDRLIEKHEGWSWDLGLSYVAPELLDVDGYHVLLPLSAAHTPNLSIVRCIASKSEDMLTIFLRDMTISREIWEAEFLAICAKVPGEDFYVAFAYHECGFFEEVANGGLPASFAADCRR